MVEMNPEQEELQEKIKNMSPEELKEFQKQRCIFCQIVAGKIASKKIYSDDVCTAILDINPGNPGHMLVMPNEHYGIMPLMPPEVIGKLFMVAKALSQAALKALDAKGTTIFVANGAAAGQKAQHFMLHVIPRKENDNIDLNIPENRMNSADMEKLIGILEQAVAKQMGVQSQIRKPVQDNEEPEKAEETNEKTGLEPREESQDKEKEFVTSEKARRFHVKECNFAKNIPEKSRIYMDNDEAEESGKLPCNCTGIKKTAQNKKPEKNKENDENVTLDDISDLLAGGI